MSELRRLEELKADAIRAAEENLNPEIEMQKYEPNIQCIWFNEYCKRLTEIEKAAIAA